MRARGLLLVGLAMLGCGGDDDKGIIDIPDAAPNEPVYETVAEVPTSVNRNLDVLIVMDDTMVGNKTGNVANNLPSLINVLNTFPGGFPDVHIGVVTSDMGTRGSDGTVGPGIGVVGSNGCEGTGKSGNLQTTGAAVQGTFVSDVQQTDGTRTTNYTGDLATVLAQMVFVGNGGCGFEQPLAAMKAALGNNPANTGFLRPEAQLLVAFFSDEDDCSFTHPSILGPDSPELGPLQSFRCTRFGVTCSIAGTTPDEMAMPGVKNGCHANPQSAYLDDVAPYVEFLTGLKSDPKQVMVATFAGAATPFEIELRASPGSSMQFPTLKVSCDSASGLEAAVPPSRLLDFTRRFSDRNFAASICQQDLSSALADLGHFVNRAAGSPCIPELGARFDVDPSTPGEQTDCVAEELNGSATTPVPACDASLTPDCWHLVDDPITCPGPGERALRVERASAPAPTTVTRLRCRVP